MHLFASVTPDSNSHSAGSLNVSLVDSAAGRKRCQDMESVFYEGCVCLSQNTERKGKVDFGP